VDGAGDDRRVAVDAVVGDSAASREFIANVQARRSCQYPQVVCN
jgi:hypothetical protein